MTPQELKERRRDRELRKEWLRKKREAEIEGLMVTIEGIHKLKAEYPPLRDVFGLAIDAASLAIDALQRFNGHMPAIEVGRPGPGRKMQRSKQ